MIDVDKLTDAELRTKLIEFGFPVMPITGTTRKVMAKKLKLLLENKNKVGSSDGRRSLGRYSSEEESDTDVKTTKKDKSRRVTMAAPVSSTSTRSTRKVTVEPEIISPRKQEVRSTTTTTTTRSRIVKNAQDDFDTGSDSESDIVASSNKYDTSLKYEDSYNDVEFNKKKTPVLGSLSSSYSRYSPPKSDDVGFNRNLSFGANVSPSRHATVGETTGLGGSLASDYAAEKLNQIRSRLSLGSPGYDRSATYTTASTVSNNVNLEEKDTPFLSNFTKRLSALNSSKKTDFDSKNDLVKEHDTNGSSMYGRSYLANFRATKGRDPTYEYKNRDSSGKNNLVSFAVLAGAALFFIFLAVVYLGMRSDTSMITSGFASPVCILHDPQSKKGVNCIHEDDIQNAVNLLNSIRPELHKRAVAHRCFDPTIRPHMTESEIITFCTSNYGIRDHNMIKHDLRNLEVMIFSNPEWGVSVAQMERNDGATIEENVAKNMEQVIFNLGKKLTSLVILNPDLPYKCTIYNTLSNALFTVGVIGLIFAALYFLTIAFKAYRGYEMKKKEEINYMVERIIEILQSAASDESAENNYVVINHVRDMILNVKERNAKQKSWEQAVKYINENESRVRTEVQTVQGEPFEVWRWIGSANLSMSMTGDSADHKYRTGRRIVDVQYIINQTLQFPHRPFFFCQSRDVEIKNEVREGFFSVYVLRCKRCLKEHSVCSEEPKNDLLDINLACVAGIVSLGLDLFQLNELCSSMRIPPISGKNFERYLNEIHDIYKDSKKESREGSFAADELISSTPRQPSKKSRKNSGELSDHSKSNGRLVTALEEVDSSLTQLDLEEKRKNFLAELEKDIEKIEKFTLKQRNEELWFNERKKRLTASNFGRIYKLLDKTNRTNVVKDLLYSKFKGNAYTEYGQENEDNAIVAFENKTGKKVEKCGLVIHKDYPFLAASPDGVVVGEDALIEIKCPYKAQNSSVEEAIRNKEIQFATYVDGALKLKREDKYYYQVQGQLHVTGKQFCYFVVWTPKGMAIELIRKDDQCWETLFPKLERFYFDHLLPEILQNT